MAKRQELEKLRNLVENNQPIPKIIVIKDENGVEQEYEVLEESEEEDSNLSLRLRESRGSDSGSRRSGVKIKKNGLDTDQSIEYYEEIIEESEEESDSQDLGSLRI